MKKAIFLTLVALVACGDDDGRGGGDTGTGDGGISFDASRPDNGMSTRDGGTTPGMDGGTTPGMTACSQTTVDCVLACPDGDGMCQQACIAADMTPADPATGLDCSGCLTAQNLQCFTENGCGTQFDAINACGEANMCADATCVQMNCGTQIEAFNTCAGGVDPAVCQPFISMCLPTPMMPPRGMCSVGARDCVAACMDNACAQACVEAEPECLSCANAAQLDCVVREGCEGALNTVNTCAMTNMCADLACVEMACPDELAAFQMCANGVDPALCQADIQACFP